MVFYCCRTDLNAALLRGRSSSGGDIGPVCPAGRDGGALVQAVLGQWGSAEKLALNPGGFLETARVGMHALNQSLKQNAF